MITVLTKAQERVLREIHATGKITEWLGGGSCRRMLTRMCDAGLLVVHIDKPGVSGTWEITAKGLRAIGAGLAEIGAREQYEQARKEQYAQEEERYQIRARAEVEERKARIIAKVREDLTGIGGVTHLSDNGLWHWITRIVEIHEAG